MKSIFKRKSQTSKEDDAREICVKNTLTQGLRTAIKVLQNEHINSDEPILSDEHSNSVCHYLEAIFVHGLKDTFFEKVSAILSQNIDRSPDPNFWPFLLVFSHKDVISQILNLSQINTDIGRCHAWIRIALNDGLLDSYLSAMIMDKSTLEYYYKQAAYLRDPEHPDIMRKYVEGLNHFRFSLACNSNLLNVWTPTPLVLAGIWNPPMAPEPVITGIDVALCFDESGQPMTPDRRRLRGRPKVEGMTIGVNRMMTDPAPGSDTSSIASSCPDPVPVPDLDYNEKLALVLKIDEPCVEKISEAETESNGNDAEPLPPSDDTSCSGTTECSPAVLTAPDIEANIQSIKEDSEILLEDSQGNSLSGRQGWSSSFEDHLEVKEEKPIHDSESFETLLENYSPMRSSILRTPDLVNEEFLNSASVSGKWIDRPEANTSSNSSSIDESDYEILPKTCSLTSENADPRTQALIEAIGTIQNEVGLNAQNYQCKACGRPIGMIYGKARVCEYDGYAYCYECHENDESVIPARILHNWDFKKYKVSKHTMFFLERIADEPLIDIRKSNPQLYNISDELNELQTLRMQLSYLRSYLFTCRESVAEEMRKKIWPKEYLYEHIHLYSISDLEQIPTRSLALFLRKIITSGIKHVLDCSLCSQKGFICEICDNPKVIYPFQLQDTFRCEECLSVFHATCMANSRPCPKCERRKKRKLWDKEEENFVYDSSE